MSLYDFFYFCNHNIFSSTVSFSKDMPYPFTKPPLCKISRYFFLILKIPKTIHVVVKQSHLWSLVVEKKSNEIKFIYLIYML